MSKFHLQPTAQQRHGLLRLCQHARYVWNLAVEQHSYWTPHRKSAPGYLEQARQLTEARSAFGWLRSGSQMVQQQALRDFGQAMTNYFAGVCRRPTWRKAGIDEGFRIVALQPKDVRRLSKNVGAVRVPKVGWVKFRWSRRPPNAKSYRITLDRSQRWHVAFAVPPSAIPAPGNGQVVGVDRGVTVVAALSTGLLLSPSRPTPTELRRLTRLQRRLARAKPGSNRRTRLRSAIARVLARQADRTNDWVEKITTTLASSFDAIRIEALRVRQMTRSARGTRENPGKGVRRKAGLNRAISASCWGKFGQRLKDKAPGRVEEVNAAFTSQTCHSCGHTTRENRKSQAVFQCTACGHVDHADVNAAKNIAAGHAVTARGGRPVGRPTNREPHHSTSRGSG